MIEYDNNNFTISIGNYKAAGKSLVIENYGSNSGKGWGDISTITYKTADNRWLTILIDAGSTKDNDTIDDIISRKNVQTVIISHWHEDHLTGLGKNLCTLNKAKVYFGFCENSGSGVMDVLDMVEKQKFENFKFNKDHYGDDSLIDKDIKLNMNNSIIEFKLFAPNLDERDRKPGAGVKENQLSICTRTCVKDFHYLSMADITARTCNPLLFQADKHYSLVKLPHHGSIKNIREHMSLPRWAMKREATYIISGTGGQLFYYTADMFLKSKGNNVIMLSGNKSVHLRHEDVQVDTDQLYDEYPDNFVLCEKLTTSVDSNGNASVTGRAKRIDEGKLVDK